ncbi:hypothetical protein ILYODFUR_017373 [Ilyodon furcidens]|uniref:Uncharacterized protein n=1 Tax=Ilyodon furcidens TaxID=33524 RepID=A0ABV0TA26_9TELE
MSWTRSRLKHFTVFSPLRAFSNLRESSTSRSTLTAFPDVLSFASLPVHPPTSHNTTWKGQQQGATLSAPPPFLSTSASVALLTFPGQTSPSNHRLGLSRDAQTFLSPDPFSSSSGGNPPHLTPLGVEEKWLYSKLLLDGRAPHPISKGDLDNNVTKHAIYHLPYNL